MGSSTTILFGLLLCSGTAWGQAAGPGQAIPAQPDIAKPTFRSDVKLVLVPVVVRDSKGHTVDGLTEEDFQLFDRGKRQVIRSFSSQRHLTTTVRSPDSGSAVAASGRQEAGGGAAATEADSRGTQVERNLIYLFDDLHAGFADLAAVREAARRHFQTGMARGERAAVRSFSGRTAADFTSDTAKLKDAVANLRLHPGIAYSMMPCPNMTYYLADLIVIRSDKRALEAVTQQTMDCSHVSHFIAERMAESAAHQELLVGEQAIRIALDTIRRAVGTLAQMPGERRLVLASPGFFAAAGNAPQSVARILDLAARSDVVISTLDARGIYNFEAADAERKHPIGSVEAQYYRQDAHSSEGVLADLASGTGGTFVHNNDDLTAGLGRVAGAGEISYVLGFSPSALKQDGSFHSLKVRLIARNGFRIEARQGYYDLKERSEAEVAESEIHDAVFSRDERNDIPIDVVTQVSKSGSAAAKVMVAVEVHMGSLRFAKAGVRNENLLSVVTVLFDKAGGYLTGTSKTVKLRLLDETLTRHDPRFTVESDFPVEPGTYRVRVVVREGQAEGMTTRDLSILAR